MVQNHMTMPAFITRRSRIAVLLIAITSADFDVAAFSNPVSGARAATLERSTSPESYLGYKSDDNKIQSRRKALGTMSVAVLVGLLSKPASASAYDKTFPVELDTIGADMRSPREKVLAKKAIPKRSIFDNNGTLDLGFGAFLWGSALWFLSGSRSNPIATPVANVLYDPEEEQWLKDRNEGLFGELPAPFLILLGVLFFLFGCAVHVAIISLADGSVNISLQLAGVLLISAGALEIGRIASGEKKQTREDSDRDNILEEEFKEFAKKRLVLGGNVHRNEVTQAFRRFHAKYRQADSEDYPLTDLEIERLLRYWNERNARAQRSSAGFYNGISINQDADIFVQR